MFYIQREEIKVTSVVTKPEVKNEFLDWSHNDRNSLSKTISSHRSSSAEQVEIEAQECIRDLLVLNQMSSSCSSRNARDNTYKKHSSSLPIYSSHPPDTLASSTLGIIHHPAYRNTYSTVCIEVGL